MITIGLDCHHIRDQKGIERYVLNLLSFFKNEKEIDFILYIRDKETAGKLPKSDNFKIKILKSFLGSSTALFQHILLPFQAKIDQVDLLFSPSYFLPLFYKGKTALTIHDIIYEAHPELFNFRILDKILVKWIGKKSAKKANLIFAPSEFTKREIIKFYKIDSKKINVTPLASDEIFKPVINDKALKFTKEKYGIKKNYFLFVAAIFDRRYVRESILAFEKIAKQHYDFQYLIIGKDLTSKQDIEMLAKKTNQKLERQAIIYFPNFVSSEEMLILYGGANATIYLSLYEGFGLPLLESASCDTPVICGNAQVFKEVLGDGCFWVDDPQDSKQIEGAMKIAIENKKTYNQTKEQGLKKAQEFSWKECAEKTIGFLKSEIRISKCETNQNI
ncbi:MAG: glycosyltransferase family 1 protein [Candidatus Paceibacterota bacterium]|jgi:glycosyltransferase involved in cell wall biosynthesis